MKHLNISFSKKILLLATILLFLPIFVSATNIYDTVNQIKANPRVYTIVIGTTTDSLEIKAAADLAGFLGITNSRFDKETTTNTNLVIVGNPSINQLSNSMLEGWNYGKNKALLKTIGNNLIIAGSETKNTQVGIEFIKNYEKNREKLQTDEFIVSDFFAPISSIFSDPVLVIVIVVTFILIIIILIIIFKIRKGRNKLDQKMNQSMGQNLDFTQQRPQTQQPVQPQIQQQIQPQQAQPVDPQEQQVMSYVRRNMARGYTKTDMKKALLNAGWNARDLNRIFMKIP